MVNAKKQEAPQPAINQSSDKNQFYPPCIESDTNNFEYTDEESEEDCGIWISLNQIEYISVRLKHLKIYWS